MYVVLQVCNLSVLCACLCFFFFFQAEDGIRDRSPSRGLGDVYKRQDYRVSNPRIELETGKL